MSESFKIYPGTFLSCSRLIEKRKKRKMINKRELRINSKVRHTNNHGTFDFDVFEILDAGINVIYEYTGGLWFIKYEELTPIELTEEWLLKLGFTQTTDNGEVKSYQLYIKEENWFFQYDIIQRRNKEYWSGIVFKLYADGGYDDSGELDLVEKIKYVHQLQNIFFALTGEELTIKETAQ